MKMKEWKKEMEAPGTKQAFNTIYFQSSIQLVFLALAFWKLWPIFNNKHEEPEIAHDCKIVFCVSSFFGVI